MGEASINSDALDVSFPLDQRISEDPEGRPITLIEAIVRDAGNQLFKAVTHDEQYPTLRKRVLEIRDEEIRERIREQIEEAWHKTLQPTDEFGHPTGEPTTLERLIREKADKSLQVRGKDRRGSFSHERSVMEDVLASEVERTVRKELEGELKQAKEQVMQAVRDEGADLLRKAVEQSVRRMP